MTAPLLEIQDLHYAYPTGTSGDPPPWVLRGINLTIQPGECVGVMGRAGSGKSTLARAMLGVVPQSSGGVIRGSVTIAGLDTKHDPVAKIAEHVGLVLEDPDMQFLTGSVEEEIAFGLAQLGLPANEIQGRLGSALDTFNLRRYADHPPHQLSGGERQRVALAAVLAMRPQLIVLDEPASRLDPAGSHALQTSLLRLLQRDIAIILISNDIEWLWPLAGRLIILDEGRIRADGPMAKVLANRRTLQDAGLRQPQLVELADCLGMAAPASAESAPSEIAGAVRSRLAIAQP